MTRKIYAGAFVGIVFACFADTMPHAMLAVVLGVVANVLVQEVAHTIRHFGED